MNGLKKRQDVQVNRLYDNLENLTPGTEEYEKVQEEILKFESDRNDKKEINLKVASIVTGIALAPVVDTMCKRYLAGFIGKVEQMEIFTSTPGRSISSWFRWK